MKQIWDSIQKATRALEMPMVEFVVEHPKDETYGDYSTNVAMVLAKVTSQQPRDIADKLVTSLQNDIEINRLIDKIEVAGAGFINFYLKTEWLVEETKNTLVATYGTNNRLNGQKTMVEFTDPNPFKEFHIGHLMSNTIGESLTRLFEANGAEVMRVNYQGDVGLHVAKSLWGMQRKMEELNLSLEGLAAQHIKDRQKFMGQAYSYGATEYEENETAKADMQTLNKNIYQHTNEQINALYQAGRAWSLEYFELIYARLGTKFNEYFFESEAGTVGLEVVDEGLKKKVLEIGDEGAVVFKGERYGLHTRVFRNKQGLPTYEGKELGLAKTKYGRWEYDKSYIVTANEIDEYFRVLIKVLTLLYPNLGSKTIHLSHGVMRLTSGKMSSRTGKIVTGEALLDELRDVVLKKMADREVADKDRVADQIAVGALKYTVLRQQLGGDIVYDPEKITNMDGDTGPYLQYTYARTQSILRKAGKGRGEIDQALLNGEELAIMRWIYRYPEVVVAAGQNYAPHLVATYIYELAQRYNTFYNKHQIIGSSTRIMLTQSVGQVLSNGLGLLGIFAPSEM